MPRNPQQAAGKATSPHQSFPTIVENVENLEFIRKTLWKNIEKHDSATLKSLDETSAGPGI